MITLEEIRQRFPTANYAPREGCKFCKGTGCNSKHPEAPCVCVFVAHEACDLVADGLAQTARKIRKDLNDAGT